DPRRSLDRRAKLQHSAHSRGPRGHRAHSVRPRRTADVRRADCRREPGIMIISRTPFRISFFGGGTDYPVWYREHGGAVLAATINKYCYISCRYLPPFFEHRIRVVYSKNEMCQS